jgi:hypothetical protein
MWTSGDDMFLNGELITNKIIIQSDVKTQANNSPWK